MSQQQKRPNTNTFSTVLFKKQKLNISSVEDLRKLRHDDVLEILRDDLYFDEDHIDCIKKEQNQQKRYPVNALNGHHLFAAVDKYNDEYSRQQDKVTSKQAMINSLMDEEKLIVKSVAEAISIWLIKKFVGDNSNREHSQEEWDLKQRDQPITNVQIVEFVNKFILSIHEANSKVILHGENVEGSSSIIVYGFGSDFTFVGREDVFQNYRSCYSQYFESMKDGSTVIRDNIKFPFIAAAPGIGKSRILKEIGISMYNEEKFFPLFVSFGNGTKMDLNLEKKPINSFCVRIIYSLICAFTGSKGKISIFENLSQQWNEHFKGRNVDNIHTILLACKTLISQYTNDSEEQINFFIGMDDDVQGSPLDTIVSAIGRYMQQPTCGYIHILLTGTYYTGIRNSLLGSGYAARYIPVRAMLPISHLSQIIDSLNTEHEKLNGWRKNAAFRHYLRAFSGYARGIEYYLSYYVSSTRNCTPKDARDSARNDIIGKYDFSNVLSLEIKNTIVQCVITRKVVSKGEQIGNVTWSDLEDKGLVMLEQNTVKVGQTSSNSDEYIITYPPIVFPELIPYNLRETYDKVFNADTNEIYMGHLGRMLFGIIII